MSSLSKVIKHTALEKVNALRTIELRHISLAPSRDDELIENHSSVQIEYLVDQAKQKADALRQQMDQEYQAHLEKIDQEKQTFKQECEVMQNQAYQEGYEAGFQAGKTDAEAAYTKEIELAKALVERTKADYYAHLESAELDVLSLALNISKTILNDTLIDKKDAWLSLIKKAIQDMRDQESITITVHPEWYEATSQFKHDIEGMTYGTKVYVYPDESLQKTSCLIETPFGKVDASLDSQLNELRDKLFEILERGIHNHESH